MLVMKPDDDVIKVQTYNMRLEKEGGGSNCKSCAHWYAGRYLCCRTLPAQSTNFSLTVSFWDQNHTSSTASMSFRAAVIRLHHAAQALSVHHLPGVRMLPVTVSSAQIRSALIVVPGMVWPSHVVQIP